MASQAPVIRQVSWQRLLTPLFIIVILFGVGYVLDPKFGVLWATLAFFIYTIASREFIAHSHRAGVRLTRQGRFEEAIPRFQESFDFFERHPWIDRFRSITLLSASGVSYREMALANIAFCYTQIGKGNEGRQYYEKCLNLFPNSVLATAALRMLNSVSQPTKTPVESTPAQ